MPSPLKEMLLLLIGLALGLVLPLPFQAYVTPRIFGVDAELSQIEPSNGWARDALVNVRTRYVLDGHQIFLIIRTEGGSTFPVQEVGSHFEGNIPGYSARSW